MVFNGMPFFIPKHLNQQFKNESQTIEKTPSFLKEIILLIIP